MSQTPQHPSEMDLKPGDVILCEECHPGGWFTVSRSYTVLKDGYLADDDGGRYALTDINPDRRFTLVSRADDGWFDSITTTGLEYRVTPEGQPQFRRRKPKVERRPAIVSVNELGSKFGYVTLTDGKPDWNTFSDEEDL